MKKIVFTLLLTFFLVNSGKSQGPDCFNADPFCTGTTYSFPNSTSTPDLGTLGCLTTSPNPAWYYLNIATSGDLNIHIEQYDTFGNPIDVDFICWGPVTSVATGCAGGIPTGSGVDCSYSTAAVEDCYIPSAVAGETYILLLTNFADVPGNITFSQTSGSGSTDCSIICGVTGFTAIPTACNTTTNLYNVSGAITLTGAPTTGTATFTNSCGGAPVVVPAPFGGSIPYTFTGLTSTGAGCTVSVVFSANAACNSTVNYVAPAPCTSSCLITFFNANISAPTCGALGGTYGITGTVNTTSPPATGTLTVSSSCGGSQVFSAPFAGAIPYSLTGITANGLPCTITAVYSADPACTQSINYTAPTCPCNMDNLFVNIGACDGVTNTYSVDVDLDFSSPPAGGVLTVDVCGSIQTFFPPFTSPMTISYTGMPVGVGTCNVTCTFSASPGCTIGLSYTAPADCSCPAEVGTFTSTLNGSGTTNYITCFGDDVSIIANGDFIPPADNTPLFGITYDPGLWLLVYSCPPTVFAPADLFDPITGIPTDPCFLGVESTADGVWDIVNTLGDGSTLYYVPITMYSMVDGYYSVTNSLVNCYELGAAIPITFLPAVTAVGVQNCAAGTVTITVTGGDPAVFGGSFTASNLLPATASFVSNTCGNGGTIVITGLNNGDFYSCDIVDANGCPVTFTGGPFIGPSTPAINPAGPFCATDPAVNLTATLPGGTWSATCGACITAGGNFNPATAGVGTYTITYTIPGCSTPATSTITVQNLTITSIVVTPTLCFGSNDGTITITAPGATQFSIDGGVTFQASNVFTVGAGAYNCVAQSAGGCSDAGVANVTEPTAVTAIPGGQDELCAGACDGFAVVAPGGGVGGYTFLWTGPATGTNALLSSLCPGTYNITVTDGNGCTASATQIINAAVPVIITSTPVVNVLCNGGANGSITVNATGTGVLQYSINGGALQASNVFNLLTAGAYTILVQDPAGCTATTIVNISEPTAVTVVAGVDQTICIGGSANITATGAGGTGPYTYTWTNSFDATVLVGQNQTVFPSANTTYTCTVTDANGCGPVADQTIITINPPLAVVAATTQSICPGTSVNISAVGAGGNGVYTYTWTNNINASVLTGASQTVSPTVTTTYTVTLTDNCGTPAATDVVTITIYPLPAVTYGPYASQGCSPLVVNFVNTTNAGATATCFWDFGDGTTSTNCNPTHVFTAAGCYDISLNIITSDGCLVDTIVYGNTCVFPIPVADFTFGPQPTDIFNTEIQFTNLTIGGSTYSWDFAGLGTSTAVNPTFIFPEDNGGNYKVCLSTVSNMGCPDSTCHYVIIDDVFLIYVPNTFTPEGDGVNDIFLPVIQGEDPLSYELMIFNRWGELIFESNNKLIGWDGTHKSIKSKEDVYVWKIKVKKKQNEDKLEYIGHVNLLR